ncbi:MAG: hypothetical protein CSA62_11885 [Planctomycetota bacterium]|nr:MAG: hypothetical protein CSA62_11885 [Planctomycetota bacterium]
MLESESKLRRFLAHPMTIGGLCFLPFAIGVSLWVLQQTPIACYDEFEYAKASHGLTELWRSLFHPGADAPGVLGRFYDALFATVKTPRPAFHFPAAIMLGLWGQDWSLDRAVLWDLWIYGPLLFLSLGSILARVQLRQLAVVLAAFACLLCSRGMWDYSALLMGELALTAVLALLVWAWLRLVAGDRGLDYAVLGVVLSWGLMTKPVFGFFALPILVHVAWHFLATQVLADRAQRSWAEGLSRAALSVGPPLFTLLALRKRLLASSAEIQLMNETMQVYTKDGAQSWISGLVQDLSYPLSYLTESFSVPALLVLVPIWLTALCSKQGRRVGLLILPLVLWVLFVMHFRNARVFQGFLVALVLLAALGVQGLPRRLHWPAGGAATLAALLMLFASLGPDSLLRDEIMLCRHSELSLDDEQGFELKTSAIRAALPRVGNQYESYQVDAVLKWLAAADKEAPAQPKRGARVFVAFGGQPLCASAFESRLLESPAVSSKPSFEETGYRYGGWGLPGGISPLFFESDYVLARAKALGTAKEDSELYTRLYGRELCSQFSPLLAGLSLAASFPLPEGDDLRLYRRTRQATRLELALLLKRVHEQDPNNPWNARWDAKLLAADFAVEHPELARQAAERILALAADPELGADLPERLAWAQHFPDLLQSYAAAFVKAKQFLQR